MPLEEESATVKSAVPSRITFFRRLLPLVTSGLKTITIRDESESHYQPGSIVQVFPNEQEHQQQEAGSVVCRIVIESVERITWDDLNETHAQQEGIALLELKQLLREIYPNADQLFVISYCVTPPPSIWQKATSILALLWWRFLDRKKN